MLGCGLSCPFLCVESSFVSEKHPQKTGGQGFRADFGERTQFDEVLGKELFKFKNALISGGLEAELISL